MDVPIKSYSPKILLIRDPIRKENASHLSSGSLLSQTAEKRCRSLQHVQRELHIVSSLNSARIAPFAQTETAEEDLLVEEIS